ncbi:MAG: 4Fe-4S binding protein [Spirochaetaceae bacterium]|nr:4Fe-4S binding protein [Spirochaetaceae bacterium]
MAIREIIEIDEAACDGCGACETGCPEGALRVIDGKARLVGESLCDGLGACIGTCPRGAITVTHREAEAYNEVKVIDGIVKLGPKVLRAHLEHLEQHGQDLYLNQARAYMRSRGIAEPEYLDGCASQTGGCPGSASRRFVRATPTTAPVAALEESRLNHWPIQLHLINPRAPQFADARLLVAADCTAFALGAFHKDFLDGRSLVIACPKLDQGRDIYLDKLATLIDAAASVEVAIMEVPCCSGLLKLVMEARERSAAKPTVLARIVGIEGGIVSEKSFA